MADLTTDVNFTDVLVEALQRYPRREAFVFEDRRITYDETSRTVSQFMQVLTGAGIGPGKGVSVLSRNNPEVWMVWAATYLLGGVYSALHPLGAVEDHAYICADAEIEILVVHPELLEAGLAVAEQAPSIREVLTIGGDDAAIDLLARAERHQPHRLNRRRVEAEDVHFVAYTGGTTGRSKGVMIPDRALMTQVQTTITSLCLPDTPRYLAVAPISHAGVLPIAPTLVRGGTVILKRGFDPEDWLRTVQDERANWSFTVPTMLYDLLDNGRPDKYDLSSLQTIMYGSSPMAPARIAEATEALGPVLLQAYGQGECVSWATILRKDEHDPIGNPGLLASCGRPVLGMRVEVLDDDGAEVADGRVGEICVRGPGVMRGYRNLPEQTAEAFDGGWLHTGDMATRDENGFLYIVERKKDMIITGGFNVYSREVEDVIAQQPSVSAVAVIGVPDERWGESVKAVVVPRPGVEIDVDELIRVVRERKGKHQAPKSIDVVDSLPQTAVGKIDKKSLRARYWSGESRQVH